MSIAEIRSLKGRWKLKWADIAKEAGLSSGYVRQIVNGLVEVDPVVKNKIGDAVQRLITERRKLC